MLNLDHKSTGNAEPRSQRRGTGTAQSKHRREQVTKTMRQPGSIVLISCYELGHQPLGLALPLGFLERAGFAPVALDIARDKLDEQLLARAEFVGISVPMHTAMRLGVRVAQRVRHINPRCHVCFYGLYSTLNADYLLDNYADSIVGGEYEAALVSLIEALAAGLPWQTVEGIEFRSVTVTAFKGQGSECLDKGHAVIYRGPFSQVHDDDRHYYPRGERIAVCERTFTMLIDRYPDDFIGISGD